MKFTGVNFAGPNAVVLLDELIRSLSDGTVLDSFNLYRFGLLFEIFYNLTDFSGLDGSRFSTVWAYTRGD